VSDCYAIIVFKIKPRPSGGPRLLYLARVSCCHATVVLSGRHNHNILCGPR